MQTRKAHALTSDLIIFCAEWCTACREFRTLLTQNHSLFPHQPYWVDIENTALMPEDLDIENLPTVAVIRNHNVTFFGVVEPKISHLMRLLTREYKKPSASLSSALILSIYQKLKEQ